MKTEITYNNIAFWIDSLLGHGRYSFSVSELKDKHAEMSDDAVKFALKRLADKGKVLSIFKGYYLILPPQYAFKGILPPHLFLDAFMKHLGRSYYLSLLNAAAYHGASHQQPQEHFVMTGFPVLRPTVKNGLRINYVSIRNIPERLLEKRKTEVGYIYMSNPALTACDLIQYEKRIGGLSRASTVLHELLEVIKPSDFSHELLEHCHITALQRLGYILESVCQCQELADALYHAMEREKLDLFRIALKPSLAATGFSAANRWNVIVNTEIEIDE